MIITLITLGILVMLSAFFSGVETAYISLTNIKVRNLIEKGRKNAVLVKKLKDNPHALMTTVLIGNNMVNVAASAIATALAMTLFRSNAIGISTGAMTLILLIFGEISPKSIAMAHNEWICLHTAKVLQALMILFWPIKFVIDMSTVGASKIFGGQTLKPAITEEEIKSAITIGEEVGSIEKREKMMIHNILKFNDVTVGEIMTPRTDMVCINAKAKIEDIMDVVLESNYSRLPVYEKRIDNIMGIVYIKDILRALHSGKKNMLIKNLMKKIYFVPQTKKLDDLLLEFQRTKTHMALVVDEYGGVAGVITIEDLLEEIVGEIYDETDEREVMIEKLSATVARVRGQTSIQQVNEKLGIGMKEKPHFETVSGYIFDKLERIPHIGERIEDKKFDIIVERMRGPKIDIIKIIQK